MGYSEFLIRMEKRKAASFVQVRLFENPNFMEFYITTGIIL